MFSGTNLSSDVNQSTYGKVAQLQENTTPKRAKRSALCQQLTTRLQGTDKTT